MRNAIHSLCITLCILTLPSCWHQTHDTKIVETNAITDIYRFIEPNEQNKDTLVIFDIDNTLATTPTDFGSDHWVSALFEQKHSSGIPFPDAIYAALPAYYQVQANTWLVPVTSESVPLVKTLQDQGITIIALTARDVYIIYRTREQLHRIGIDFSCTSPKKHFDPYGKPRPILYDGGIIYANNHDKGVTLLNWLKQMEYQPKKILFVDDKLKNVLSVEKAAVAAGYPFVGIRYGYTDERVKNIDMQKMASEYHRFLEMYPDSPAVPITHITSTPLA